MMVYLVSLFAAAGLPQNGDLMLDYLKDNKPLAQEIISGHIISRISVEFT